MTEPREGSTAGVPGERPFVLVLDDDRGFADMVAELLVERGCRAEAFTEPEDVLARAADPALMAAVLDRVMPGMDGLEVAGRIKAVNPEAEVVILTAHPDLESAVDGIARGVFAYLEKASVDAVRIEWAVLRAVEKARVARRNRELVARLQETNRLLQAVNVVSVELGAETHLDRILERLVDAARHLTQATFARAVLVEATMGGDLLVRAAAGDGGEALQGLRLRADEGLVGAVIQGSGAVLVQDPSREPRYSPRVDELPLAERGLICAPLRHGDVSGALSVAGPPEAFRTEDAEFLATLARHAAVAIEHAHHRERALNFFTHASELLVEMLETLDTWHRGHSRAVAELADMVTRRLGMGDEDRRNVHLAALLHDIGKVRLAVDVLQAQVFSPEARRLVEQHPALGVEMLQPIMAFAGALPIILAHHERWDGSGYPRGLAGEEIPLGARVVAVADVFDAITRGTPYSPARPASEALAELEALSGVQFDPRVVRMFLSEYARRGDRA